MNDSLLELKGISKSFGSLKANDNVNLRLQASEIHALLGENGAGKSTLVKIMCGMLRPDTGEVRWNGKPLIRHSPSTAQKIGIGVVFQHFSIFRAMTVAENIALGLPPMPAKQLEREIDEVSSRYGLAVDAQRPMHTLSVGEWQRVEIVRRLLGNPKLLVLDEPTSVLTPQEAELLFSTLRKLVDEGCAVLYISHRLEEIRGLCHKATIMRNGRVVSECDPQIETEESLAEIMIGHKPSVPARQSGTRRHEQRLTISNLNLEADGPFGVDLKDVNLEVGAGRITAIAGIAGNGQQELGAVLSGERLVKADQLLLEGKPIGNCSLLERRNRGLHFVPEERLGHAAVADFSLWENTFLTARNLPGMSTYGFLNNNKAQSFAKEVIDKYDVRCSGADARARSLSGGNLQKFILGRELEQRPRAIIVMQPTWGVDAGAEAMIHQALLDLANLGTAVLVISQDLGEIFVLADDVAVICEGRLSEEYPVADVTSQQLGLLMGGQGVKEDAAA